MQIARFGMPRCLTAFSSRLRKVTICASGPLPSVLRAAGLRSIVTLFAEVFAPRLHAARPGYARPGEPADVIQRLHPLDYVCYMFWDIAPIVPGRDDTLREGSRSWRLRWRWIQPRASGPPCTDSAIGITQPRTRWPRSSAAGCRCHPQAPDELRAYAVQASAGTVQ
jgi:hypothetical protein